MLQLLLAFFIVLRQSGHKFFPKCLNQVVAFCLRMFLSINILSQLRADARLEVVVISLIKLRRLHFPLGFADLLPQLVDRGADLLDLSVSKLDGIDHRCFFHFFCGGLDHHDAVSRAHHHDVQQTIAHLVIGRINDESPFN